MLQFTYKGCVFETDFKIHEVLFLVSVSGKVLEIPDTYEGQSVNSVYIEKDDTVNTNNLFEYCTVDSMFSSVEEIRIPASLYNMNINRHIFPNLNKVIVDSENKYFHIVDERLLCASDNSLIAYCGKEELDEYIIPEGIKKIDIGAFAYTKIHKIIFPSSVSSVELRCVDHSIFLQELDDVVEFAGIIHVLKKDVDELIITDFEKIDHQILGMDHLKRLYLIWK